MSVPTYRAGIIGLGFIGGADQVSGDALGQQVRHLDGTHLTALQGNPRIKLVAGSSRDAGRRERFAQRTAARVYSDWQEMIEREKLDIVSVATYAPAHAEISAGCAEGGVRAIYCEKPIATRPADADRMLEACEAARSLLVINHNLRFNPNARRLRDFVAKGGLGQVTSASIQWGSGRLGNVGTHMMDAIQMLSGRKVEAVSGLLDLSGRPDCRGPQFRDPGGWGILRLEGGLAVAVDAADYGKTPARVVLNGALGRSSLQSGVVNLEFWDGRQEQWPMPEDGKNSMDHAVAEIVAWLAGEAPFPYRASDAAWTLEAIVAFHVSHGREGCWTRLPLAGADRDREVMSG